MCGIKIFYTIVFMRKKSFRNYRLIEKYGQIFSVRYVLISDHRNTYSPFIYVLGLSPESTFLISWFALAIITSIPA